MKNKSRLSANKLSNKSELKMLKKQSLKRVSPELREVIEGVGSFMEYWGFSAIDGKIWALLYLSPKPLSSAELASVLGFSKAMMSLSLNELLKYKVIESAGFVKHGTQVFASTKDIKSAVENVIRTREKKMLAQITRAARKLELSTNSSAAAGLHGQAPGQSPEGCQSDVGSVPAPSAQKRAADRHLEKGLGVREHNAVSRERASGSKSQLNATLAHVDPVQALKLREMCESAEWMLDVLILAPGLLASIGNFQTSQDSKSAS